jgi:Flp pilus assembly protein TadG
MQTGTAGRILFGKIGKFRRDRRGATAIEFTLLALPFAMLAFAILETTVSFTAQQVISNAADKYARQFRTGQMTAANTSAAEFKTKLCEEISIIVGSGCTDLEYDLRSYASFAGVPTTINYDTNGDIDTTGFAYNPGGNGTINSLRVFYRWPVMTDIMKSSMSNLPDGKTLIFSSATWQNEEF